MNGLRIRLGLLLGISLCTLGFISAIGQQRPVVDAILAKVPESLNDEGRFAITARIRGISAARSEEGVRSAGRRMCRYLPKLAPSTSELTTGP